MYIFSNVLGVFVFDGQFGIVDKIPFENVEDPKKKEEYIQKIKSRHKILKEPDNDELKRILLYFKNNELFPEFYNKNLQVTKSGVRNSVNSGTLIIQAINSVDETDKAANLLVKKLREWYGLYNPEFSRAVQNHEKFVEGILENEKDDMLKKLKINPIDSIGADFEQENLEPIMVLARRIYDLYQLKKSQVSYISSLMDGLCPNIKAVCDVVVAARLIEHSRSLKRLSEMPASTIQILGAEKALFRHMKTGAKSPKHGVIVSHELIASAPLKMHGKIARALADKISIASKVDYFKGNFIGDKLRKELEEKFSK